MADANKKHKIVIVGGGAGGLELATRLGKKLGKRNLAEIMLIDASASHIWKPLLHEVAAGVLDATEEVDYLAQAHRNHFLRQIFLHIADGVGAAQSFSVGVNGRPRSPLNSFFNRRSLELVLRRMISGATRLPISRR